MEDILHYVWKHRLFQKNLITAKGVPIEILDVGLHNTDEGPDFFNAKIKVEDKIWVGNIEIHPSSNDWNKHSHQTNKLYNTVILHVVGKLNCEIKNEAGRTVPQCEIKYPSHIKDNIEFLLNTDIAIPCCNYLKELPSIHLTGWLNALLLERLERKSNDIGRLLEKFNNSWADVFYVLLSRAMGFGLNSDAFERLALSLPLKHILKQGDNSLQIEALLLGQAGMLDDVDAVDDYTQKLRQEYAFLKNKYQLTALDKSLFRNMRVRPAASPQIRIVQLAALLKNIQGLYSKVIESKDLGQIRLIFHVNASDYWQTHYQLGQESPLKHKYIGDGSLDVMIINAVVPLVFSYGKKIGDELYIERALNFLEAVKPESNSIVKQFAASGIVSENAYYTQALIQLKREYCEKRKCLYCRVGYRLLSEK